MPRGYSRSGFIVVREGLFKFILLFVVYQGGLCELDWFNYQKFKIFMGLNAPRGYSRNGFITVREGLYGC